MAVAQGTLSSDDDNQILDAIGSWLEGVEPQVKRFDHEDIYPHEIVNEMKELGLFSLMYPVKYDGLGMNASSYAKVVTKLSETWMSLAGIINTHMMLGQLIERFGTDEQKEKFMGRLASGALRRVQLNKAPHEELPMLSVP
jgi:alkylation response protein AidB-like acyl-CoA dehydrogenase